MCQSIHDYETAQFAPFAKLVCEIAFMIAKLIVMNNESRENLAMGLPRYVKWIIGWGSRVGAHARTWHYLSSGRNATKCPSSGFWENARAVCASAR